MSNAYTTPHHPTLGFGLNQGNDSVRLNKVARSLGASLKANAQQPQHAITERLRVARLNAINSYPQPKVYAQPKFVGLFQLKAASANNLAWNNPKLGSWLGSVGNFLPLLVLVLGLQFVGELQDHLRAQDLAEIDMALLTDDLPLDAFTDEGFAQFLRTPEDN